MNYPTTRNVHSVSKNKLQEVRSAIHLHLSILCDASATPQKPMTISLICIVTYSLAHILCVPIANSILGDYFLEIIFSFLSVYKIHGLPANKPNYDEYTHCSFVGYSLCATTRPAHETILLREKSNDITTSRYYKEEIIYIII